MAEHTENLVQVVTSRSRRGSFPPWRKYLHWFAASLFRWWAWLASPPLLLTTAVTVAVLAIGVGDGVGLPDLFWNDDQGVQFVNGLFVGLMILHVGLIGYVLAVVANPDFEPKTSPEKMLVSYLASSLVPLAAAVAVGCYQAPGRRYPACLGVAVSAVGGILVARWVRGLNFRWATALTVWLAKVINHVLPEDTELDPKRVEVLTTPGHVALLVAFLFPVLGIHALFLCFDFPAFPCVCTTVIVVNALWGFFAAWSGPFRAAWCFSIVLLLLLAGVARDRVLPGFPSAQIADVAGPTQPFASPSAGLLSEDDVLGRWKAALPEARPPLIVVAASGGGIRAATWTASVLAKLNQCFPRFVQHVRIITGASGGMVGAAHFVAHYRPDGGLDVPASKLVAGVAGDSLSPILRAFVELSTDRGEALEKTWNENSGGVLAQKIADLRPGEAAGWRPSLVFSPMLVEDGRRLLISNLDLRPMTFVAGAPRANGAPGGPDSVTAIQLFELFPGQQRQLGLATAALMNATFPWVTAAMRLPSDPERRVVDAGYYDNYGVELSALWLKNHAAWIAANTSGVLLVQIRDQPYAAKRVDLAAEGGPRFIAGVTSPVVTPIAAALAAREATMAFRNDEYFSAIRAQLPYQVRTAVLELDAPAPLSWYLTAANKEAITSKLTFAGPTPAKSTTPATPDSRNRRVFSDIAAWWSEQTGAPSGAGGDLPLTCLAAFP